MKYARGILALGILAELLLLSAQDYAWVGFLFPFVLLFGAAVLGFAQRNQE